jgi:hypothetical protein
MVKSTGDKTVSKREFPFLSLALLMVIAFVEATAIVALYGMNLRFWLQSDTLVFFIPFILAAACNIALILRERHYFKNAAIALAFSALIAIVLSVLGALAGATVAFNLWGS